MPRVLVVDDDKVGRATLTEILQLEGFEVEEAEGGKAVIQRLGESDYDVMLLDLKMPDLDGLAVLEASSRLSPETQVIVFTAHGSLDSAIQAVRHGAHDYLLKPASCEDLLAAVHRAGEKRRHQLQHQQLLADLDRTLHNAAPGEAQEVIPVLRMGDLRLDLARRRLESGGRSIELTPAETRLFLALYRHRGQVVGYRELVAQVQGYRVESWEAPAMMRPVVSRLRCKLQKVGGRAEAIGTVRGSGYLMVREEA